MFSCSSGYKNSEMSPLPDSTMVFLVDSASISSIDTLSFKGENSILNQDTFLIEMVSMEFKGRIIDRNDTFIYKDTILIQKIPNEEIKLDTSSVLSDLKKSRLIISDQQKILDSLLNK
jgi:hypothetical protein